MESTEIIGKISGLLVLLGAIPFAWRVFQGKIKPNIVTWILFSVIELSLLLNYGNVGAQDNIWPAVFGFVDSLIITIIVIWKNKKKIELNLLDCVCLSLGAISIALWWYWLGDLAYAKYSLFAAIIADIFAGIPTLSSDRKKPSNDRPFMWVMFAVGYSLDLFAIKEYNLANYSLPVYMSLGSLIVSIPLIAHRLKLKIPLKHWI